MHCDNGLVVNLVTAMLGSITPNWRAVFVNESDGRVEITFLLATESPDDRDEISDVEFEFQALQIESEIVVGVLVDNAPLEKFCEAGQLIFARKE